MSHLSRFGTLALPALVAAAAGSSAGAVVILEDDFNTLSPAFVVDGDADNSGGALEFVANGDGIVRVREEPGNNNGDPNLGTLNPTVDTTGFENVTVTLAAAQLANGSFEGNEFLELEVDTGNGFVTLFRDDDTLGDNAGQPASGDTFTFGPFALGAGAADGSFDLRISIATGFFAPNSASAEEFQLDNLPRRGRRDPRAGVAGAARPGRSGPRRPPPHPLTPERFGVSRTPGPPAARPSELAAAHDRQRLLLRPHVQCVLAEHLRRDLERRAEIGTTAVSICVQEAHLYKHSFWGWNRNRLTNFIELAHSFGSPCTPCPTAGPG